MIAGKAIFLAVALFAISNVRAAQVELGIDVLKKHDFEVLRGKRIGLVTNQTGVDSGGVRTRVILKKAPGVRLVRLFTPEHGLDGRELAGKYVASRKDSVTGLAAYSLYGPTRKPTPQMLDGLDALVFDMQDIGSRSYTYISTMAKCMEAAGEKGIEFIVLDRPNPLGGLRVEGPPIEQQWISFVGQLPVPYIHGMTAGELARMANALGWVQPRCKLNVVNMQGWERRMLWSDTGLRWIQTSPNIPRSTSPVYYAATGIVGELPGCETGCGSSEPFEVIGAKWVDAQRFTSRLRSLEIAGVSFSEYSGKGIGGSRIRINPRTEANLCALNIYLLSELNRTARPGLFSHPSGKLEMFWKVYGSRSVAGEIDRQTPVQKIIAGWAPHNARFEESRKPYLLY